MEKTGRTNDWDMFLKAQIRWHDNSKESYVVPGLYGVSVRNLIVGSVNMTVSIETPKW